MNAGFAVADADLHLTIGQLGRDGDDPAVGRIADRPTPIVAVLSTTFLGDGGDLVERVPCSAATRLRL